MRKYTELYNLHEENNDLHPDTAEAVRTEQEFSAFIKSLPEDVAFQLDIIAGKLARAYEKQGFLFGLNVQTMAAVK